MSDHSISCKIVNNTTGTLTLADQNPNKHTNLSISDGGSSIGSGISVVAFTGSNSVTTGCGGSVTYTLPNNTDLLVIAYNTSTANGNSTCYPMLQSSDPDTTIGCDEYYCETTDSYVSNQNDGVTTTITVYQK